MDSQLFHTELGMANLVTCLHSVIMTIPGIGTTNGGMILGEIGDIHRFPTPGKLLAFDGLDRLFISLVTSRPRRPGCPNEARVFFVTLS